MNMVKKREGRHKQCKEGEKCVLQKGRFYNI